MTCPPFCDICGGNLRYSLDFICNNCKREALRKCRKEHIRKDEFVPGDPNHFRLQTRGGSWRYYRRVG